MHQQESHFGQSNKKEDRKYNNNTGDSYRFEQQDFEFEFKQFKRWRKEPKEVSLNLNGVVVAAAAVADTTTAGNNDIDNAILHPKYKNLIGYLDGFQQQEYLTPEYNNLNGLCQYL